ncbi:hypothetical protein ACFSQ3_04695 [Sphingobacterium corticis]|uniref:DUF3325 domain-containing protein n=1 Tax=Sphingobacterium corticis TaxID=1812823 RepID=A0ABW5NH04_9SPHI
MITTSCLLFFTGFVVWMSTSKRLVWPDKPAILLQLQRVRFSKTLGSILFLAAAALCIQTLGWASGLFATIVILMTMASVCVLFFPLSWLKAQYVAIIYLICLLFEVL